MVGWGTDESAGGDGRVRRTSSRRAWATRAAKDASGEARPVDAAGVAPGARAAARRGGPAARPSHAQARWQSQSLHGQGTPLPPPTAPPAERQVCRTWRGLRPSRRLQRVRETTECGTINCVQASKRHRRGWLRAMSCTPLRPPLATGDAAAATSRNTDSSGDAPAESDLAHPGIVQSQRHGGAQGHVASAFASHE